MAQIEDRPGFETFGEDVKAAREALNMPRRVLVERVDIDSRYLANIELEQTIPSLPVIIRLVKICGLPMEPLTAQSKEPENCLAALRPFKSAYH